jgi:hypothetical protein
VRKELAGVEFSAVEYARERKSLPQWKEEEVARGLKRAIDGALSKGATPEEIQRALVRGKQAAGRRRVV